MPDRGHVALVTGAGRNIGRAIVLELAGRGYDVVVNGRADRAAVDAVAEEARALSVRAEPLLADVGDPSAVKQMAARALEVFGKVDVVVNNAAIRPESPFLEMTDEDWHRVVATDLHSAFYTSRAFLPGMVEQGWGRIINLTGMNAIHGYSGRAHVSVAKHGLWGLTKALAKEFGPKGVTVNAISPGPIRSEHRDASMTRHIESQLAKIPLGRLGEPTDIAKLCGLLASDEGGFISGQMIAANGAAQT
ncbi:MAG: 3-oxoacyl-ACP reductase family protein [Gammaproteobacteria bacterium]|nr:3-oxoacyl-ACP reductase family protein [Gammaproteobacteria bacterium]